MDVTKPLTIYCDPEVDISKWIGCRPQKSSRYELFGCRWSPVVTSSVQDRHAFKNCGNQDRWQGNGAMALFPLTINGQCPGSLQKPVPHPVHRDPAGTSPTAAFSNPRHQYRKGRHVLPGRPIVKTDSLLMAASPHPPAWSRRSPPQTSITPSPATPPQPGKFGFYSARGRGKAGRTAEAVRGPKGCSFCLKNGEMPEFAACHQVKDPWGRVVCPILRAYRCPQCGATGETAHTLRYCPGKKAFS